MGDTFTAKEVISFLSGQPVEQKFGILQKPTSEENHFTYGTSLLGRYHGHRVESFNELATESAIARCTLEFEIHTKPNIAKEVICEYSAYFEFYHYIRYHGVFENFRFQKNVNSLSVPIVYSKFHLRIAENRSVSMIPRVFLIE